MAKNTRRTRRLRGGAPSNGNVERAMEAERAKIKPAEAKVRVEEEAKKRAFRRWDYARTSKNRDKLILTIKQSRDELAELVKRAKRIEDEEFIKAAQDWKKTSESKKGYFW